MSRLYSTGKSLVLAIVVIPSITIASSSPKMIALNGQEIFTEVIGHSWKPDRDVPQIASEYVETFDIDGSWHSWRAMRGPVQMHGNWTIQNDKICVNITQAWYKDPIGKSYCRTVWRSRDIRGNIAMTDIRASGEGSQVVYLIAR